MIIPNEHRQAVVSNVLSAKLAAWGHDVPQPDCERIAAFVLTALDADISSHYSRWEVHTNWDCGPETCAIDEPDTDERNPFDNDNEPEARRVFDRVATWIKGLTPQEYVAAGAPWAELKRTTHLRYADGTHYIRPQETVETVRGKLP